MQRKTTARGRRRDERFVVTRAELARLIDVTPDRVTKLVAEGMPVIKTGGGRGRPTTIDLARAVPWLLNRRIARGDGSARDRYFTLQADKIEQEIRRRAGELVEAADIERRWAGLVTACRERLLSLPGTALQRGVPAVHEDLLLNLVDEALAELAARGDAS